jgi:capsular exopolysaccharide synthesis family protein
MNANQLVSAPSLPGRAIAASPALLMPTDRLDVGGMISFFRRRLGMIVGIICLSVLAGALVTLLRPVRYTASAIVSVETPKDGLVGTAVANGANAAANTMPSDGYVNTQIQIIQSRDLAAQVAQRLGWLRGKSANAQNAIITDVQKHVSAFRRGESYTLQIDFVSPSAQTAAAVANAYADQFAKWEPLAERNRKQSSIAQLGDRLKDLRGQALADTERLQRFRIANNMLSTSGASLTEQEISGYNQAVTQARAQAAEDQARLNTAQAQLRSGSNGDDVGDALLSPVISALRSRQAVLAGTVANLSARYGPNHPELIRAKGELDEVGRSIEAEISRVISNLQAKQSVSAQRLASLTGSLAGAQHKLAQNNESMVGLSELERQAQTSQELYEAYLNSYKTLIANEDLVRPNARILSSAIVPVTRSSPNWTMNLLLALIIGIGVSVFAAIVAESQFNGLTSADDVEQRLGLHVIGAIPLLASVSNMREPIRAIGEQPRSAFTESFRALRTSIDQAVPRLAPIIAITSALPREGKTTMSICLAQVLSQGGARTLLVDCDWHHRGASRAFHMEGDYPGLAEVLEGSSVFAEALVTTDTGLSILPIRTLQPNQEPLLTGAAFEHLLDELRNVFDYIVLDLPPVLPIAATRVLAKRADATVMVVRWRKTSSDAVGGAISQLPLDGVNLIGVAMSQVDARLARKFGARSTGYDYHAYRAYYR